VDLTLFSSTNFLSKSLIIKNPESEPFRADPFTQTEASSLDYEIKRTIQIPEEFNTSVKFIPWSNEYLRIRQNIGTLKCYDPIPFRIDPVGIESNKYQGEFYLSNPVRDVKVENIYWSPNKLIYKLSNVEKKSNNMLVVNQNYFLGWIVKMNNEPCNRAISYNGLLATKLDSFSDTITFEFNPFMSWFICRN
jgi:hypothetical protein